MSKHLNKIRAYFQLVEHFATTGGLGSYSADKWRIDLYDLPDTKEAREAVRSACNSIVGAGNYRLIEKAVGESLTIHILDIFI